MDKLCKNVKIDIKDFNLSRFKLVEWINTILLKDNEKSIEKVEDLCTGEMYAKLLSQLFPGCITSKKIKKFSKNIDDFISNWMLIKMALNSLHCIKEINVEKLSTGNFKQNLMFLHWFKVFYEKNHTSSSKANNNLEDTATILQPDQGIDIFSSPVVPDNMKVATSGRGVQKFGLRCGEEATFKIVTENFGDEALDIHIVGPGNAEIKVNINCIENIYYCSYHPHREGVYVITVFFNRDFIMKPIIVNVGPHKESKINVYGPGLRRGISGYPAYFFVETNGETNVVDFFIDGPAKADIFCEDNGEGVGIIHVKYMPTVPGEYSIHICNNGEDIPTSPFMATIRPNADPEMLVSSKSQVPVYFNWMEAEANKGDVNDDIRYETLSYVSGISMLDTEPALNVAAELEANHSSTPFIEESTLVSIPDSITHPVSASSNVQATPLVEELSSELELQKKVSELKNLSIFLVLENKSLELERKGILKELEEIKVLVRKLQVKITGIEEKFVEKEQTEPSIQGTLDDVLAEAASQIDMLMEEYENDENN